MTDRGQLVYRAKLAEQAECFDEMVSAIKEVAADDKELSVEERNLLSVAYKNIVGMQRTSYRVLGNIETVERGKDNKGKLEAVSSYASKVKAELKKTCNEVIELLDSLIAKSSNAEARVFFYKMQGDYHRYMAEVASSDERSSEAELALAAYKVASDIALEELPPTSPIRLGLALNFSVFYYEILVSPERACHLAKQAFDDAVGELDSLPEASYRDSTLIMQLLRENLTLWSIDMQGNKEDES